MKKSLDRVYDINGRCVAATPETCKYYTYLPEANAIFVAAGGLPRSAKTLSRYSHRIPVYFTDHGRVYAIADLLKQFFRSEAYQKNTFTNSRAMGRGKDFRHDFTTEEKLTSLSSLANYSADVVAKTIHQEVESDESVRVIQKKLMAKMRQLSLEDVLTPGDADRQ